MDDATGGDAPDARRICTVGHGARTIDGFLAVLGAAGVETLVDVRRYPGSRRHPQFGRETLQEAVEAAGRQYVWQGETLGGRRRPQPGSRHTALRNASFAAYADHMDTPQFRGAVDDLIAQAATRRPAVMCAETLWWHCHRMLIADALVIRGATVEHLLEPGVRQPHRLTAGVRPGPDGWPVYDDRPTPAGDDQPTLPGL